MPIYKTKKRDTRTYLDRMEEEKDKKYERYSTLNKQDRDKITAFDEMMRFQTDRKLDTQEYDELNEATSILEEILESLGYDVPKENRQKLKNKLLSFVSQLQEESISIFVGKPEGVNKVDPHADMIELNIGAIMKLKHSVPQSLIEMAKEINSRKGEIVNGKFEKYTKDHPKYEEPYKADYTKSKIK